MTLLLPETRGEYERALAEVERLGRDAGGGEALGPAEGRTDRTYTMPGAGRWVVTTGEQRRAWGLPDLGDAATVFARTCEDLRQAWSRGAVPLVDAEDAVRLLAGTIICRGAPLAPQAAKRSSGTRCRTTPGRYPSIVAGAPPANFVNRTRWTQDSFDVLRGLNSESVDLVYADPPFNGNKNYEDPVGSKAAGPGVQGAWTLSDVDAAPPDLLQDARVRRRRDRGLRIGTAPRRRRLAPQHHDQRGIMCDAAATCKSRGAARCPGHIPGPGGAATKPPLPSGNRLFVSGASNVSSYRRVSQQCGTTDAVDQNANGTVARAGRNFAIRRDE